MTLPKAIRMRGKKRVLLLTMAILGVIAAAAVAATVSGNGTLVGSPQNDTITAKGGDDVIYGEGGSDTIYLDGNSGNDFVDGDGMCKDGNMNPLPPGVYPNPLRSSDMCEDGNQDSQGQMDTVSESGGSQANDVVLGGAAGNTVTLGSGNDQFYSPLYYGKSQSGTNTITMGGGNDTIYGGPNNDTITVGVGAMGNDKVYLGTGNNTVTVGKGDNFVYANRGGTDNGVDNITCGSSATTVYANKQDTLSSKCHRINGPAPAGDPPTTKHRTRAKKASRKHHTKAGNHKKATARR